MTNHPIDTTEEKRNLTRAKLGFIGIIAVFLIHFVVGEYMLNTKFIWPLTYWPMYKHGAGVPANPMTRMQVRAIYSDGETQILQTHILLQGGIANQFIRESMSMPDAERKEHLALIVERIETVYGKTPLALEIWELRWNYDLSQDPILDVTQPDEEILTMTIDL